MRRHFAWCKRAAGIVGAIVFVILLAAAPVVAQERESSAADSATGWVYRWLNFALVFGGIVYAIVKWGRPVFRARTEEISRLIEEGARARAAAEQARQEIQAKLAGIAEEVKEMRAQAKRDAEVEAQRLRSLAREEAQRIEGAAQAEIAAAERAARMELKAVAARKAVERAEAMLRQELTPKAEAALFEAFVGELSGSVN
jgi:F-type H+-transporting ATPase subunit b